VKKNPEGGEGRGGSPPRSVRLEWMEEEASGWWLEEEEALGVGGGRSS
jgi:hypothetical protein